MDIKLLCFISLFVKFGLQVLSQLHLFKFLPDRVSVSIIEALLLIVLIHSRVLLNCLQEYISVRSESRTPLTPAYLCHFTSFLFYRSLPFLIDSKLNVIMEFFPFYLWLSNQSSMDFLKCLLSPVNYHLQYRSTNSSLCKLEACVCCKSIRDERHFFLVVQIYFLFWLTLLVK